MNILPNYFSQKEWCVEASALNRNRPSIMDTHIQYENVEFTSLSTIIALEGRHVRLQF